MYLTRNPDKTYIVLDVEANGLKPTKLWCMVWSNLDDGALHIEKGQQRVEDAMYGVEYRRDRGDPSVSFRSDQRFDVV